ncbi:ABC transporter permease [Marinithermus hydrothermalis]|uniref:ABC-type transporter, integral membrane subunit n=1 Tax=Marinithermus hydrothermalis (strain DSM 14884 / JCM 11576 / T1) TaxID=869210 RepID=F2NRB0_MARHT|nr:ABC transporter permease [Marinithermus hydrothermalis]AEB12959.1 ABC-type transporter, integral membrane subunit [Marinithermus hydrothermalis DSM 14884]
MLPYLVRRLLIALPTLFLVTVMVFSIQRLLPGDPALALAGEERDPEVIAYIREKYHLNDPLPLQYYYWMRAVLQGDLGESIRTKAPVTEMILQKLPVTAELAVLSILVALAIAIPAGVLSAVRKESLLDYTANVIALSGLSIPNFWLGIMLILLVSVHLGWLPASGYVSPLEDLGENLKRMIMPAFVLGTGLAAALMRQTRSAMLEVLKADYVRTARAKGLAERVVIYRHALRNALIPVVTLVGLQLGGLLSGAVLTEQVFVIPGFGKMIVDAVFNRDYPMVQGVVLFTATAYILVNLLVDLAYALINPKIRLGGEAT